MSRKVPDFDLSYDGSFDSDSESSYDETPRLSQSTQQGTSRKSKDPVKPKASVQNTMKRQQKPSPAKNPIASPHSFSTQQTPTQRFSKKCGAPRGLQIHKTGLESRKLGSTGDTERTNPPPQSLSVVVIGDVDTGKSTLMGQLFHQAGMIPERDMHKLRKMYDASSKKKGSLFSWIFDESAQEREKGISVDLTIKTLNTSTERHLTILDAPGHKDFLPRMIKGAMLADAAILVIEIKSDTETSFNSPQTKEQLELIFYLQIRALVVVLNKMDYIEWNQFIYQSHVQSIKEQLLCLHPSLDPAHLFFTPASALYGENIVKRTEKMSHDNGKDLSGWMEHKGILSLLETLDLLSQSFPAGHDLTQNSPSLCIIDLWGTKQCTMASAKVIEGCVAVGDTLYVCDSGVPTKVLELCQNDTVLDMAYPGAFLDTLRLSLDPRYVAPRSILCADTKRFCVTHQFTAQIQMLTTSTVMLPGQTFMLHLNLYEEPATVFSLDELISRDSCSSHLKNPRCLIQHDKAKVTFRVDTPVCCRLGCPTPSCRADEFFSAFILRHNQTTLAHGYIVSSSST